MSSSVSLPRRRAITAGVLLGMTLGSLEATVVSTAMPTVIATLGGLSYYGWVFSAYLLTSTGSVPIWGRLSDLYGRRRLYLWGVGVFLLGTALSGAATSMMQLIVFRAIQGLGAGAIIPLSMTIVGELYSLRERARVQALFSGVFGVASIAGPLIGGYITDALSWRWVFYLNIPFGLLASAVLMASYPVARRKAGVRIDWLGAALLFGCVTALLLALSDPRYAVPWAIATVAFGAGLWMVEHRATHPILPLDLFNNQLVSRSLIVAFMAGTVMYGAIAFMPLFVQVVQGGTATQAGQILTPLFLGWVGTSVFSARLTMTIGFRPMTIAGAVLLTLGFGILSTLDADTPRAVILGSALLLGCGLGGSMFSLLLAVQHGVARAQLGLATSLNQFARSVGSAVGVAIMGALLARGLSGTSMSGDIHNLAASASRLDGAARVQFASALARVFTAGAVMSVLALIASLFLPHVSLTHEVAPGAGEQMLAAEMTNLDPDDEPFVLLE